MKKIPVALQVYSVRDYDKKDFRGTARANKIPGSDPFIVKVDIVTVPIEVLREPT